MDNNPGNPYGRHRSILQDQTTGYASGVQCLQAGRLGDAQAIFRQILTDDPRNYQCLHQLGMIEYRIGNFERALECLRRSLLINPDYADGLSDLAQVLSAMGREEDALKVCERAVAANPSHAGAFRNLGNLLLRQGRLQDARIAYVRAVELDPEFAAAYASLADVLAAEGRLEEALLACDRAISLAPNQSFAYGVKGSVLHRRGKFAEAARAYARALQINPDIGILHARLANALRTIGRFEEALEANQRAVDLDPTDAEAHSSLGLTLQAMGRTEQALTAYRQAITIKPRFLDAYTHLGLLQHRTGRREDAIRAFQAAISIDPECEFALTHLAGLHREKGELEEAAAAYRRLAATKAGAPPVALYDYCTLRRQFCDWDRLDADEAKAVAALLSGTERVPPFASMFMQCTPADRLGIAQHWAQGFVIGTATRLGAANPERATNPEGRLRIGYLSSDFRDHPTAGIVADLVEHHDRKRFEVFAYCWSHDDNSEARTRLMGAFDNVVDLHTFSNADAARRIRDDGIDVLIDLKGYTPDARTLVLASRPAPVQVSFLGYPATMGASFVDYLIADPFVAPMDHAPRYSEKLVHLPDCYQPPDSKRTTASFVDRGACRLPENGFVFCAFSNPAKITRQVFLIWTRLLQKVPGSVLWLLDAGDAARRNLELEAKATGIDPSRLIFAPVVPQDQHLARYRVADLFLDTLPVNAHSIAGEAIWAGLPLLTCAGDCFAGRVGGSLLKAAGVPELVTHSLVDYEMQALRLATESGMLESLRGRLERARNSAPLFNAPQYARNLESAYAYMVLQHAHGRAPEAFAVSELPGNTPLKFTARA